jgi:ABC-type polysaccharide/polyol phosphate transport system ATPase subunit
MAAVKDFCDRAVLINDGEIVKAGSVDEVINHYHELNS